MSDKASPMGKPYLMMCAAAGIGARANLWPAGISPRKVTLSVSVHRPSAGSATATLSEGLRRMEGFMWRGHLSDHVYRASCVWSLHQDNSMVTEVTTPNQTYFSLALPLPDAVDGTGT